MSKKNKTKTHLTKQISECKNIVHIESQKPRNSTILAMQQLSGGAHQKSNKSKRQKDKTINNIGVKILPTLSTTSDDFSENSKANKK